MTLFLSRQSHKLKGRRKNPSQNDFSGEYPSGQNPSKVSVEKTPHPILGLVENPSPYFQACGENPSTLQKDLILEF